MNHDQQIVRRSSAVSDFALGPRYLLRGFELIREPSLRMFVIAPIAVNIVVIVGLLWLFGSQWSDWLDALIPQQLGLPGWLDWLGAVLTVLETLLWLIGLLLVALVFCYSFTLLANLIGGPFNGLLSARVERHLAGQEPDSGMSLVHEAGDAIVGECRLWLYYLGRALLLLVATIVLFFIPLINSVIPILWFAFGAFMLSFEYMDNPMGNRGMAFRDKITRLRQRRWLYLGFGSAVTLVTMIPLANLIVMPAAVAGATALWLEQS